MGWDDIVESNSGGGFTKLEVGKPILLHILGEPEKQFQHWIDGNKTPLPCVGEECLQCRQGTKLSKRYKIKVFNLTNKQAEVFQCGTSVLGQINDVRIALSGSIDTVDFQVSKAGSGLNTKYTVINLPTKFKPEMMVDEEPAPF